MRVRSEGGEKDPFPILGTLYAKRGLFRISRKDNKSIILHLERPTKGPGPRRTPPHTWWCERATEITPQPPVVINAVIYVSRLRPRIYFNPLARL
jgi:hypothetical protein